MSEKWHQFEICIVINDKPQGSIAKHYLSVNLLVKEFLKLVNIWRSYRQNG